MFASLSALCLCLSAYLIFFTPEDSPGLGTMIATLPSLFSPCRIPVFPALAGVLVVGIVSAFVAGLLACRNRAPLALTLGLFAFMPVASVMSHWASSEQRNHWFGYWFGHDMFTPPFAGPDGKLTYDPKLRAAGPERNRKRRWFIRK